MTFIITLIALVTERFFDWSHLRKWQWFSHYQTWLNARFLHLSACAYLALCVLPYVAVIGIVNWMLAGWLFGFVKLIFGMGVLVYCLGPVNFWAQVYSGVKELHDHSKASFQRAQEISATTHFNHSKSSQPTLVQALFMQAYLRVFAVIFWFVVLGPQGAVLYRLIALAVSAEQLTKGVECAVWAQRLLDWLPVRIFTFIFALGGHFTKVFLCWKRYLLRGPATNEILLMECGIAALGVTQVDIIPEDSSAQTEAMSLLDRVFVMSIVILAAVVLLV